MNTKSKLNRLNFGELIHIDCQDPDLYSYSEYYENNSEHKINGYCTICDKKQVNVSKDDESYTLTTIGHGIHTLDYAEIISNFPDISDWNMDGVMFLFQTPPKIYSDHFRKVKFDNFEKYPTFKWYFALSPDELELKKFPHNFKGKIYDNLITSIIITFKLGNAYITDLIKCGLCKDDKNLNIRHFQDETIKTCIDNYLMKEIEILKPKIIFTFSKDAFKIAKEYLKNIQIVQLPHPRARGLDSDNFKTLYFWKILSGLCKVGIIHENKLAEFMSLFNGENK